MKTMIEQNGSSPTPSHVAVEVLVLVVVLVDVDVDVELVVGMHALHVTGQSC